MVFASLSLLRRYSLLSVQIRSNVREKRSVTPLVFIGNNDYGTNAFTLGTRGALAHGQLSIYFADAVSRLGLARLSFRVLTGDLRQAPDLHYELAEEVVVTTKRRRLSVALDGELHTLTSPLYFKIHSHAFCVVSPHGGATQIDGDGA